MSTAGSAATLVASHVVASSRRAADGAAPARQRVRVMTYNIHHAEDMFKKVSAAQIADVIKQQQPDLVALQEVDRLCARTGGVDFVLEFERLTGLHAVFGPNIELPGGTGNDGAGQYGNLILSRFPVSAWTNTKLEQVVPGGETRGVLVARVEVPAPGGAGGPSVVAFANTHLDHRSEAERIHSVEQLEALLLAGAPPGTAAAAADGNDDDHHHHLILCGDFNATPDAREMQQLCGPAAGWLHDSWAAAGGTGDGATIPSIPRPTSRIDYVMVGKSGKFTSTHVASASVIQGKPESDHLPVVVDLRL